MGNDTKQLTRKINSLQFGEIQVEQEHIFTFNNGLLGFEELREFVLISEEDTIPFKWLISLEEPEVGFPLLSPWHIDLTFEPEKDFDFEKHVIYVVITLEDEKGLMTANMKAPILFDVVAQTGEQVILPKDKYSPNYVITQRKK
jgi:flagellar assembly factor FliW